jgi:predicted phosphodiesterase
MATKPISENVNFPKWMARFKEIKHLGGYVQARKMRKLFGGSLNTWKTRVGMLADLLDDQSRKERQLTEQEKEQYFVQKILLRPYPYRFPGHKFARKIDLAKTLIISDPHAPYESKKLQAKILAEEHNAGHLHINGDAADFYSKSRFPKAQGHIDFYAEIRGVFDYLEWCAIHWHRVTIIRGNHDDRPKKMLIDSLKSDELWMVDYDLLKRITSYLPNIELVGERVKSEENGDVPIEFVWQFGDVVFTHIERSQVQASGLLKTVHDMLIEWSEHFNLQPFKFFVQGHNHRCDTNLVGGKTGFLCPMAADPTGMGLRYIYHPSMRGKAPVLGYAVLVREHGKTVFNKSRIYRLE